MELSKEYIQNLRQDYSQASLSESDIDKDPLKQFEKWFKDALESQLFEPNVMTLATASLSGKPSARILLLKGFDENGFTFFTNYDSKKGKELEENPHAALVFFWAELQRQVRIEGVISKVNGDASSAYFHSRPKGSQISAVASPQSNTIPNREVLEEKAALLTEKYNGLEVPRPLNWGGYQLNPTHIEFWQGRSSRLHDRIAYTQVDGTWLINRLAP